MKFSFETRLFLLCTALLVLAQSVFFAFAADDTTDAGTAADYACGQTMIDDGSALLDDYENFLNEYFLIDNPSSNQVEEAMDYYRYVEDSLNNIYGAALKIEGNKTLDFANSEVTYCSNIRDQYLRYARVLLQKQALSSANAKRTFEIVDGLKVMNDDLGDFSEQFLETFPGIFNQMNNALPCYARQCISQ